MSPVSNLTTTEGPHWNTPQHHGPAVSVVTWIAIVGVILAVISRIITRCAVIHKLQWDDILCLVATVSQIPPFRLRLLLSNAHSLFINGYTGVRRCSICCGFDHIECWPWISSRFTDLGGIDSLSESTKPAQVTVPSGVSKMTDMVHRVITLPISYTLLS